MFGIKMIGEAKRTVEACARYAINPFQNPAEIGDAIDLAYSHEFETVGEAKAFVRRNRQYVRFRAKKVVFYDREEGLT